MLRVRSHNSAGVRARVESARERQIARYRGRSATSANAYMTHRELREFCTLDRQGESLLRSAISRLGFSARAYHRVLKISRTIADLEGVEAIASHHVAEAIQYRSLDRGPGVPGGAVR